MLKTKELQKRLEKLLGFVPKASLMCSILGLNSENTWYQRVQRDTQFTYEEIQKIEEHFGINILEERFTATLDCIDVDYYKEVKASCGFGCVPLSESSEKITIAKTNIPNYTGSKQYSVIVAQGNSMLPSLVSGDKLIIEHTEDNNIIDDNLYVFTYEGQVYVKRLVKNVNELVIKSDNPDKETYRTQYITKDDMNRVNIIGKCIGLMRDKV